VVRLLVLLLLRLLALLLLRLRLLVLVLVLGLVLLIPGSTNGSPPALHASLICTMRAMAAVSASWRTCERGVREG
jgi:hypothetical protein